jgi:hypothetical protein
VHHHKGHRQVGQRQPRRLRDGNEALAGLQVPIAQAQQSPGRRRAWWNRAEIPGDNAPAGRLQTPIQARFALHQAEVDHASAQAGRVRVAALQ